MANISQWQGSRVPDDGSDMFRSCRLRKLPSWKAFFFYKKKTHETGKIREDAFTLSVLRKGFNPTILLWGWDWDHQNYSREGYGSFGLLVGG